MESTGTVDVYSGPVNTVDIIALGDAELLQRADSLARSEKAVLADLIESLAEVDRRRLWKGTHASFFEYCAHRLRMHPASAAHRIRAVRAFRAFPPILELIRTGRLSLEAVVLLNPHLSGHDAAEVVSKAVGMNHRRLEAFLAARRPAQPKPDSIRYIGPPPAPAPPSLPLSVSPPGSDGLSAPPAAAASDKEEVDPAPPAVRFAFDGDEELRRLIDRARRVLRHKHPDGRLADVFRAALRDLLLKRERRSA
jgi:hypothetical protein